MKGPPWTETPGELLTQRGRVALVTLSTAVTMALALLIGRQIEPDPAAAAAQHTPAPVHLASRADVSTPPAEQAH